MTSFFDPKEIIDLKEAETTLKELMAVKSMHINKEEKDKINSDIKRLHKIKNNLFAKNILKKDEKSKPVRPHSYHLKKKEKKHIEELQKKTIFSVEDRGTHLTRCYRGKRSKFLKKVSNKRVRVYKGELKGKNCDYRRVFNFWWELY